MMNHLGIRPAIFRGLEKTLLKQSFKRHLLRLEAGPPAGSKGKPRGNNPYGDGRMPAEADDGTKP
ncbi:MAG TPA: hypothetical protein VLB09_08485 [Nitrospiria bacterium]|nr:hypothetical protein [Nitrospiria bacterium]